MDLIGVGDLRARLFNNVIGFALSVHPCTFFFFFRYLIDQTYKNQTNIPIWLHVISGS